MVAGVHQICKSCKDQQGRFLKRILFYEREWVRAYSLFFNTKLRQCITREDFAGYPLLMLVQKSEQIVELYEIDFDEERRAYE